MKVSALLLVIVPIACSETPVEIEAAASFGRAVAKDSIGGPDAPVTLQALVEMVLHDGDGFEVTLIDRECAAQGNRFSITAPVSSVLTSSGCQESIGRVWPFPGPFSAGTTVEFSFYSGYTHSPGKTRVSGVYPSWTVACEDGYDADFNDLIFSVRILGDSGCPRRPYFADPAFRNSLGVLWDLSFPDAPVRNQRERFAWIVESEGSFETVVVPVRSDACEILGRDIYAEVPEGAVGYIHTHPSETGTVLSEGDCERVPGNMELGSGPSHGDLANLDYFERVSGREMVGIILEPDQVYEFTAADPAGTAYPGCEFR